MKTTLLFLSVFLSASLFGQDVYIPDANFKAYLVGNSAINTNSDTEIQLSEANVFDGEIDCSALGISDLTGIEAFSELTVLSCWVNQLASLDVSQNTALTQLSCGGNELTSLDVSQNTALTQLYCEFNQLTSLDLSQNNDLAFLDCENNQLTSLDVSQNNDLFEFFCGNNQLASLDVSQNAFLGELFCENNQLTSLDVSQNTELWWLICEGNELNCLNAKNGNNTYIADFMVTDNPNLTCIEVDDAMYSTISWIDIDSQMYFSEDCNIDCSPSTVEINELSTSKSLIQILDLMGRETSFKPNTPLIYVYDDGSIEKVFSVEY